MSALRSFVAAAAALLTTLASPAAANAADHLPFTLKEVGRGVYAAIDAPDHSAGSNAGFIIGDDAVLVVDSFFSNDASRALIAEIQRLTPKPIRYVVNTHYHIDHTGGDQAMRDAGAIIIAHRNVRTWIRTRNSNLFGAGISLQLTRAIERLPLPDIVTDKDLIVWLGSRKVVVRTVLGHTGGDLSVFVPDAAVLFTGDLLWRKMAPNLIDGSVKEWVATDRAFAQMANAERLTYVPGHGDLSSVADVRSFTNYLIDLERFVREGRKAALNDEAMAKSITPRLLALYPDWAISNRAAAFEIHYMDQELAGTKRRPVPDSK